MNNDEADLRDRLVTDIFRLDPLFQELANFLAASVALAKYTDNKVNSNSYSSLCNSKKFIV